MRLILVALFVIEFFSCYGQGAKYSIVTHVMFTDIPKARAQGLDFSYSKGKHCTQAGIYLTSTNVQKIVPGFHAGYQFNPWKGRRKLQSFFTLDYIYFHGRTNDVLPYLLVSPHERISHIFDAGYGLKWNLKDAFYLTSNFGLGIGIHTEKLPNPDETSTRNNAILKFGLGYYF
jgi:hypothetical protein